MQDGRASVLSLHQTWNPITMIAPQLFVIAALSSTGLAGLIPRTTAVNCTRDSLLAAAGVYTEAQQSGNLDALQKLLSSDVKYRQNNKDSDFKSGLLSKALKLDHNRTTADTTACASYTELISTAGPYVIGTQLRHDGDKIVLVDSVVATTGDWAFNAKQTLSYVTPEDWGTLDEGKRSTRDVLKAAGDAYLDMWTDGKAARDKVPCT